MIGQLDCIKSCCLRQETASGRIPDATDTAAKLRVGNEQFSWLQINSSQYVGSWIRYLQFCPRKVVSSSLVRLCLFTTDASYYTFVLLNFINRKVTYSETGREAVCNQWYMFNHQFLMVFGDFLFNH